MPNRAWFGKALSAWGVERGARIMANRAWFGKALSGVRSNRTPGAGTATVPGVPIHSSLGPHVG